MVTLQVFFMYGVFYESVPQIITESNCKATDNELENILKTAITAWG
jgi:hypothetical protein